RPDHPLALAAGDLVDEADVQARRDRAAADPAAAVAALRRLAAHDDYRVRHNALVLLDRLAPDDPDVDALLRDRLAGDPDDAVLRAAAAALLRRRPDDPAVLDALATRAEEGQYTRLGAAAVQILAECGIDHPLALAAGD